MRTELRAKPSILEPTEPIYELEITGETEAEKQKRDIKNQRKRSTGKIKQQELENEDHFLTISHGPKQMQL